MKSSALPVLLTLGIMLSANSSFVFAQDYGAMIQQQLQQSAQLSQQMQQMQNNIVQQNMQNPQIQAMYMQYRNSGGTMSFEQFAYNYAATGGFFPEGKARYYQHEQRNQQMEHQAWQGYQDAQAGRAQAMQQMQDQYSRQMHQRGNVLQGTTDYVDPQTGYRYNLPHTVQPNTYLEDPGTGQGYYNDQSGNYYREDPNGYWSGLQEEE